MSASPAAPTGTVAATGPPSDNPFFSNANANAKKVYALGIRNSNSFTFHDYINHLWEAENGLGDSDEINRIMAGGNYGGRR
jgi:glucose/arabinose dehydrogenase